MEQTESLLAIAQIALGLAGFGGVFIALGRSVGARHPALAAEALSAAGLIGAPSAGVFFSGLVFLVAFGSYLFARMLFLWRG